MTYAHVPFKADPMVKYFREKYDRDTDEDSLRHGAKKVAAFVPNLSDLKGAMSKVSGGVTGLWRRVFGAPKEEENDKKVLEQQIKMQAKALADD